MAGITPQKLWCFVFIVVPSKNINRTSIVFKNNVCFEKIIKVQNFITIIIVMVKVIYYYYNLTYKYHLKYVYIQFTTTKQS